MVREGINARGGKRVNALRLIVTVVLVGGAFVWGFAAATYQVFPYELVRRAYRSVRHVAVQRACNAADTSSGQSRTPWGELRLTEEQKAEIDQLMSLPYLQGSKLAGVYAGVTAHDPARANAGFNLVVSGHAPEATLMDMDGQVLHRWSIEYDTVWPDNDLPDDDPNTKCWRRAHVDADGNIYAIFQWHGLVKLDRDSNLLWAYPGSCFNDLWVTDDGMVYVLENETRLVPELNERDQVFENFIVILDTDGAERRRVSMLDALLRSEFAPLFRGGRESGDIMHGNTIQVLDGKFADVVPAFAEGNILTSLRNLDTIAVLDLEKELFVWAMSGRWIQQHEPVLLPEGSVLVFNNVADFQVSEVLEFDPLTQRKLWSYRGSDEIPFYSRKAGSCQRLPNGNTLIVESGSGRAFEAAPDGEIVWEFINPQRAGKEGELIATLFDLVRLEPDYAERWLEEDA
jgi:hypothetical protein